MPKLIIKRFVNKKRLINGFCLCDENGVPFGAQTYCNVVTDFTNKHPSRVAVEFNLDDCSIDFQDEIVEMDNE